MRHTAHPGARALLDIEALPYLRNEKEREKERKIGGGGAEEKLYGNYLFSSEWL